MATTSPAKIRASERAARQLGSDLQRNAEIWTEGLRRDGLSKVTTDKYRDIVRYLDEFLAAKGMPRSLAHVRREHIEDFRASKEKWPYNTTASRYEEALLLFFAWVESDRVVGVEGWKNPMANWHRIRTKTPPRPQYSETDMRTLTRYLLKEARKLNGKPHERQAGFVAQRDLTIIRLLLTTGVRVSELANLAVDDAGWDTLYAAKTDVSGYVDWDAPRLSLMRTKSGKPRNVGLQPLAVQTLNKYNAERLKYAKQTSEDWLWVSFSGRHAKTDAGRFTQWGVRDMIERRCKEAGIRYKGVHSFRAAWVSNNLARGVSAPSIAAGAGWSPKSANTMLARYNAEEAERVAAEEITRAGFGADI